MTAVPIFAQDVVFSSFLFQILPKNPHSQPFQNQKNSLKRNFLSNNQYFNFFYYNCIFVFFFWLSLQFKHEIDIFFERVWYTGICKMNFKYLHIEQMCSLWFRVCFCMLSIWFLSTCHIPHAVIPKERSDWGNCLLRGIPHFVSEWRRGQRDSSLRSEWRRKQNSPFQGGWGDVLLRRNTPLAPLKGGMAETNKQILKIKIILGGSRKSLSKSRQYLNFIKNDKFI